MLAQIFLLDLNCRRFTRMNTEVGTAGLSISQISWLHRVPHPMSAQA